MSIYDFWFFIVADNRLSKEHNHKYTFSNKQIIYNQHIMNEQTERLNCSIQIIASVATTQ